jgi:hypothetical protein
MLNAEAVRREDAEVIENLLSEMDGTGWSMIYNSLCVSPTLCLCVNFIIMDSRYANMYRIRNRCLKAVKRPFIVRKIFFLEKFRLTKKGGSLHTSQIRKSGLLSLVEIFFLNRGSDD